VVVATSGTGIWVGVEGVNVDSVVGELDGAAVGDFVGEVVGRNVGAIVVGAIVVGAPVAFAAGGNDVSTLSPFSHLDPALPCAATHSSPALISVGAGVCKSNATSSDLALFPLAFFLEPFGRRVAPSLSSSSDRTKTLSSSSRYRPLRLP
jgi:hypothetical protein